MAGAFTDMYALAKEYLDECVKALDITDAKAPARRFISPGPPAWDCCDQLSVHIGGPAVEPTSPGPGGLAEGHRIATLQMVNAVALTATILRCAPGLGEDGMTLPQPAELDATSMITSADVWVIWNHIASGHRQGLVFAPKEREVYLDPAVAQNQQGGCCGWQVTVRVQLNGFKPSSLPVPAP